MSSNLFRGKSKGNDTLKDGEWVIGSAIVDPENQSYCIGSMMRVWGVDPDTIGQHTDLTDKSGVEIFEGDILETINSNSKYWLVEFKYGCFVATQGNAKSYSCPLYQLMDDVTVKVAGNIYDNPDLLST